jgi:hypothetical protein
VVVRKCGGKGDGREEDVHLLEMGLPLGAKRQPAMVLLLPVRKRAERRPGARNLEVRQFLPLGLLCTGRAALSRKAKR